MSSRRDTTHRLAELHELKSWGVGFHEARARLGLKDDTLYRWLKANGQTELLKELRSIDRERRLNSR